MSYNLCILFLQHRQKIRQKKQSSSLCLFRYHNAYFQYLKIFFPLTKIHLVHKVLTNKESVALIFFKSSYPKNKAFHTLRHMPPSISFFNLPLKNQKATNQKITTHIFTFSTSKRFTILTIKVTMIFHHSNIHQHNIRPDLLA